MSRTSCHQSVDHGRQVPSYLADSYHVFLSSWCVFTKSQFPNFPIPNAIIKHHDPQSINKMLPFWGWVNPAGHQHNSDSWMFIRPNLWNPSRLNRQEPDLFPLDSPPMAERSRSPLAGIGQTALERKEEVPNEILLEAQTFKALQEQVHENTARLNSVDWVATQTASLVHRDQELQASKQLLLMGWPKIDEKEREKEIKWMANYYGLMNKYQGSTTLKTKNGLAHFTIVDMWDKEARNEFLQHIKRDPHQVQGNTIVGRPQIPRYRREQDAPMKCAMKTLANIIGDNPKFSPTWEIQALWHDEWLLAVNTNDKDITKVQLYVPDHVKAEFETKFQEDWSAWKAPGSSKDSRPQKHLQVQIYALTDEVKNNLDARYAALKNAKVTKNQDVDMEDSDALSRAHSAKGGGKRR